jgi:hypothetical protein
MTDPWTPEEDSIVIQQYHRIGPKWVEIGKMLNGRSGNNVKNRWHKHLCRLGAAIQGIAPAIVEAPPSPAMPPVERPPDTTPVQSQTLNLTEFFLPTLEPVFSVDPAWNGGFSFEDSLF